MKSNCTELARGAASGLPVGLYGSMAVAVGAPVAPKEAYTWQAMQEEADTVPLPVMRSMTELPSSPDPVRVLAAAHMMPM
jgi:hypothetical protein